MMPMDININPVPCCSVNGFVNIIYDNSNVTAFLAVVICSTNKERLLFFQETHLIYLPKYLILPNINTTNIPFDIDIRVKHFSYAIDCEFIIVAQSQTSVTAPST